MLHNGECPSQHRTGNNSPIPRAACSCLLQPGGMHPAVPDKHRAHGTPWAVTRAPPPPLLPSEKHPCFLPHQCPEWEKYNCHSTDCFTVYIHTPTNIHLYIYMCGRCGHIYIHIYTHIHTHRGILDIIVGTERTHGQVL